MRGCGAVNFGTTEHCAEAEAKRGRELAANAAPSSLRFGLRHVG